MKTNIIDKIPVDEREGRTDIEILLNYCADRSEHFADFMFSVHCLLGDLYLRDILDELFRLGWLDFESFYADRKAAARGGCLGGHCSCNCTAELN